MIRQLFIQLSKESFAYGLSASAAKLIGLILVPLYGHVFSPGELGSLDLVLTTTSILSSLLILGLDTATALTFYKTDDVQKRRLITSTFFYFELPLASLVCVLLFAFAQPIALALFGDAAFTLYVQLGVSTVPFAVFITMFLDIARLVRLPWRYVGISVGNLVLTASLIVFAVVVFKLGVAGVFAGTLAGNAIFSLAGWWMTRPQYTWHFSLPLLRRMLLLGLPMVPAVVSYWVINFSNRWFLTQMASLDQVGILGIATRLASPVVLIITAFQIAWVPFSLSIARETAADAVYSRMLPYYLAASVFALLLLTLFAAPLIELFTGNPAYLPAEQVLALVGMGSVANGAMYLVSTGINLAGKTLHLSWPVVVGAVASLALNLLLIPAFGIVGAALAGLAANLIPVVLMYLVAQRLHRIPYDLTRAALIVLVGATALTIATLVHPVNFALSLSLRSALLLAFVALLVLVGVVRGRDVREAGRLLKGMINRMANS